MTFVALRLTNEVSPLSVIAVNVVLVLGLGLGLGHRVGLGLGVDYSLFPVSRFREETHVS